MSTTINWCTNLFFASSPQGLGTVPAHVISPLNDNAKPFIMRADNGTPSTVVNVFDLQGNQVYTLERFNPRSKKWCVYEEPAHKSVARLDIGLITRSVHTHCDGLTALHVNSGSLFGALHRHYYDKHGGLYSWNRRSQNLERISNPRGQHEEYREVIAAVRKLRPDRFDWQIIIDTNNADVVTTSASAFITMKTQWSIPSVPITLPWFPASIDFMSTLDSNKTDNNVENVTDELKHTDLPQFINNEIKHLLVFEPRPVSHKPRDFFNPPDFMKPT